ncbi:MAG: hypothetical protein J1E41_02800 [Ruminococcus sp.]|nr:hypothetical protein [Ruminococcus sp.]
MEIKDIMYLVVWGALAIYLIYSARKISPILYILGGFFVFMFAWNLINNLTAFDMFAGAYNIVFRGICLVFLAVLVIIYIMIKKKPKQ